jgi:nitrate/nitrite transport system ATP-binding protein
VSRSKSFAATVTDHDPRNVPTVRPGLGEPTIVSPPRAVEASPAQIIAR